jgi:hypothetical protein
MVQSTFNAPRLPLALLKSVPQLDPYGSQFEGAVSVSGTISGPWQPLNLVAQGRLAGEGLRIAGRRIDSLRFGFDATRRRVTLSSIESRLYGGQAGGALEVSLGDRIGGSAELSWTNVNAGQLLAGIPPGPVAIYGATNGRANLQIPNGALNDVGNWTGAGAFAIEAVDVYEWHFRETGQIDFTLDNSHFKVPRLQGLVDGSPLDATVSVGVTAPHPLEVKGSVQRTRLERLRGIPGLADVASRIAGEVDFDTHVQGTLSPVRLSAKGSAVARQLKYDRYIIDHARFAYSYRPEAIEASEVIAELYGGKVTGGATVALSDDGASNVDAQWSDLNLGRLIGQALGWRFLDGRTSGELDLQIPPGTHDDLAGWTAALQASLPDLRWRGKPVASLSAQLTQRGCDSWRARRAGLC